MLFPINFVLWLITIALGALVWAWFTWWGVLIVAAIAALWCPYLYESDHWIG